VVAVKQHGGADADGEAADRGDQRLLVARQHMKKLDGDRFQSTFDASLKFADIAAGAECARTAGQHDAADRRAGAGLAQRSCHRVIHRLGQRVLLFRAIHPNDAHGAFILHDD